MAKKYLVRLTAEEQHAIDLLTKKGKASARRLTRAHILRLADAQQTDESIAAALDVGVATIERIRERFVIGGLEWALSERRRLGAQRKLDGKQEAFLVALACSAPPAGQHCWSMQRLAERIIELNVAEPPLSDETVRRVLKKTNSSPGCVSSGAFQRSVQNLSGAWKMCWTSTPSPIMRAFRWSASTSVPIN
jgi:transposase